MTNTAQKPDVDEGMAVPAPVGEHFTASETGFAARLRSTASHGWIYWVLVLLVVILSILNPVFFSQSNWINTTNTAVTIALLATAQALIIISGGIDLSQGAVLGLSGVTAAWVMEYGFNGGSAQANNPWVVIVGFATGIVVGLLAGVLNGLIISRWNISPFVMTLATLGIATGASLLMSDGQGISNIPAIITDIGNYNILGWIPIPVLIAALIAVAAAIALRRTRFGVYTYTIGDNEAAAARAGIPVARHRFKLYVLSGVISAVAGLLLMTRLGVASPSSGASTDLLNAIAAVVLGGASLSGGRGSIARTMAGVGIIAVLVTGLVIINVQVYWQQIAVGIILVLAVFVDQRSTLSKLVKR